MPDAELQSFKTNIDLQAYAALQGYELDRKPRHGRKRVAAMDRHAAGFRPFAGSVPLESARRFFELEAPSPYMQCLHPA